MNIEELKISIKSILSEILNEKSVSKSQQRFMGQVYAIQTGELKSKDLDPKYKKGIMKAAKSMKKTDAEDFAKTKHKGIPNKVKDKKKKLKENCGCSMPKHKIVIEKGDALNDENKINLLKKFVYFCCKDLEISEPIRLHFTTKRGGPIQTTASFNPNNNDIFIYTKSRHLIDILRSTAHEVKHWHQNLKGELTDDSGKDGSAHENEAHVFAGLMLRQFSKKFPAVYE